MKGFINTSNILLMLAILSISAITVAGEFYKVVKADGSVEYTQTPPAQNAEPVDLPGLSVISPEVKLTGYNSEEDEENTDDHDVVKRNYRGLAISSPADDESILGTGGKVMIQVNLPGELAPGDRLQVSVDGKVQSIMAGTALVLSGVDRGEHSLQARIINSKGRVMASSPVTRFHMKQIQAVAVPGRRPRGG
ncbi:MAG: hypothetical protein L3J24_13540 [Xanthomonadales bacterium]|nr:hypothetical protein [Xanthomonadales bacterium]